MGGEAVMRRERRTGAIRPITRDDIVLHSFLSYTTITHKPLELDRRVETWTYQPDPSASEPSQSLSL